MKPKIIFLLSYLVISSQLIYSQKRSVEIGGKLISKIGGGDYFAPGIGSQFIYKITEHSGVESGFYFEINPRSFLYADSGLSYSNKVYREKVLRIPLLYRFESRLFNITSGVAIDYLLNRNELNSNPPIGYKTGDFMATKWLAMVGISKYFMLTKTLVLEPEIRSTSPIPEGGVDLGLNISLRTKIF